MNILIFHNIEDIRSARNSSTDYVFCFERYAPEHNYLYHNITLPLTKTLRSINFDAIIFESTSLGVVTFRPRALFSDLRDKIREFVNGNAIKIAFPQDDYNHSALLDQWLSDLRCHAVGTALYEYRELLYPRTISHVNFFPVLTGYVDDLQLSHRQSLTKPLAGRDRLLGQRVTMYPPRGGRHARTKGVTAEIMKEAAAARGMRVEISTSEEDTLFGDDWYRFLGDCRFVLGAEGGTSIWDPYGEISDRIDAYVSEHPHAEFEEIEAACFPGEDGRHIFSAISPRLFEAALMGCCQILVEGDYRGILRPHEHYIPLRKDCSNIDEVFESMSDEAEAERRIEATYKTLIENPEFRYSTFVGRVMSYIDSKLDDSPRQDGSAEKFAALRQAHWRELADKLMEREREVGFCGTALGDRVLALMYGQFAEPYVIPNPDGAHLSELHRAIVQGAIAENELLAVQERHTETKAQLAQAEARLTETEARLTETEARLGRLRDTVNRPGLRAALGRRMLRFDNENG